MRSLLSAGLFCAMVIGGIAHAAPTTDKEQRFRIAILLFDEVEIIDFTGPYEIFHQADFEVYTVSTHGQTISTVANMQVTPSHSFATLPVVDALLIPGGNVGAAMQDNVIGTWLKSRQPQVDHILSVCTGSHILAANGLLDGLTATTFHKQLDNLAKDYPKITVVTDQRWVDNGQIVTSAGLSSGLDGALHLVSKVKGDIKARELAMHLEYDWSPEQGFVRGKMADMRLPDNKYDWPQGIVFERLYSLGDERQWQKRYRATTDAGLQQLVQIYQNAMAAHPDWTLSQQRDTEIVWTKRQSDQIWHHRFSIESQGKNQYLLTSEITK